MFNPFIEGGVIMADKRNADLKYIPLPGNILLLIWNDLPNEYFRTFKVLPVVSLQVENMFDGKWNIELILGWLWFTINISYANKKLRKRKD